MAGTGDSPSAKVKFSVIICYLYKFISMNSYGFFLLLFFVFIYLAANCSPPPEIQNGRYEPLQEQYKFGEAVTYSCNGDNILDGNEALTCSETGTFHPSPPQCLGETLSEVPIIYYIM